MTRKLIDSNTKKPWAEQGPNHDPIPSPKRNVHETSELRTGHASQLFDIFERWPPNLLAMASNLRAMPSQKQTRRAYRREVAFPHFGFGGERQRRPGVHTRPFWSHGQPKTKHVGRVSSDIPRFIPFGFGCTTVGVQLRAPMNQSSVVFRQGRVTWKQTPKGFCFVSNSSLKGGLCLQRFLSNSL